MNVRIWWFVLVLTVSSVITVLLAPPMSVHGTCDEATALILISPGYQDGEMAGSDPGTDRSTCAKAAWRLGALATGLGVVGGAATAGARRIGLRRRTGAD